MGALCTCFGAPNEYQPKEPEVTQPTGAPTLPWTHIGEPHTTELNNYLKQRADHVQLLHTAADVRAKLLRNVAEDKQLIDVYPKGRQFLADDDYMVVVRDLLNLSNILDDMEQTGWVPYQSRTPLYNLYCKLYRLLLNKAGR